MKSKWKVLLWIPLLSQGDVEVLFHAHGQQFGFSRSPFELRSKLNLFTGSPHNIWLCTLVCHNTTQCDRSQKGLKLQQAECCEVILYTVKGPLPVYCIHLICDGRESKFLRYAAADHSLGCRVSYQHDYYVEDKLRVYYQDVIPHIIQIGEHQFAETRLIKMWRMNMNCAW